MGLCVLLVACEEDPKKKVCRDTMTGYVMAKSLLEQKFIGNSPYFPERTEVRISISETCAQTIDGYFTMIDDSGRQVRQEYSIVMSYGGGDYWAMESLELR